MVSQNARWGNEVSEANDRDLRRVPILETSHADTGARDSHPRGHRPRLMLAVLVRGMPGLLVDLTTEPILHSRNRPHGLEVHRRMRQGVLLSAEHQRACVSQLAVALARIPVHAPYIPGRMLEYILRTENPL